MSSPSSPPPPPPLPSTTVAAAAKKPQPITWSQQETIQLILIYQNKWHANNRRHLRAPQWEEIAAAVAARCGDELAPEAAAKSGTKCRHKMEKLRRRYRSELPRASSSNWPYFSLMDSMERGPISARPVSEYHGEAEEEDEEEEDEEGDAEGQDYEAAAAYVNKSRSINHILRKPSVVNRFPGNNCYTGFLLPAAAEGGGKRKRVYEDEGRNREEEEEEGEGIGGLLVVEEVKKLIEKMKGVERKKMEMVKETERWRMEMEMQRMEMMLASQKKILDLIASSSSASDDD
ncbi:Protein FIP2 [Linum grandiflorum]